MNDMPTEFAEDTAPPLSSTVPQPDDVAMLAAALAAVRNTEGERRWTSVLANLSGWLVAAAMVVPLAITLTILKNRPEPKDRIWVSIIHSDGTSEAAKPIENMTQTERENAVTAFVFNYVNYRMSYDVGHLQYNFDFVRFTTSPDGGAQDEYIDSMSKAPNRPTEWLGALGESRISDEQVSREGENAFEVTYTQKIRTKEGTWLPDHHRRARISYAVSPSMPAEIARRIDPLKLVVTRWDDHPATYDPTAPGGRQ
jgi:type IV secretory pathway component VirB8